MSLSSSINFVAIALVVSEVKKKSKALSQQVQKPCSVFTAPLIRVFKRQRILHYKTTRCKRRRQWDCGFKTSIAAFSSSEHSQLRLTVTSDPQKGQTTRTVWPEKMCRFQWFLDTCGVLLIETMFIYPVRVEWMWVYPTYRMNVIFG